MTSSKVREFYWRFYSKRKASFLSNLYRASITGDEKDIHRTRLDMKKINAMLGMFKMLNPEKFSQESFDVFTDLFSFSGKIRELQVNEIVVQKFGPETPGKALFTRYLRLRENKLTKQFLSIVQDFDEKKLKRSERTLKKICNEIKIKTLQERSEKFILKKAKKIKLLRDFPSNPENVHGIRKHLKAMVTILTLISMVFSDEHQDALLSRLNQTEMLIGEWHDNEVLMEYIEHFLQMKNAKEQKHRQNLKLIQNKIMKSNQLLLNSLITKIDEVLNIIFPVPVTDESSKGNL